MTERAVCDLLLEHLPEYARDAVHDGQSPFVDWDKIMRGSKNWPMFSSGEQALVLLAAHVAGVMAVTARSPEPFGTLLTMVDWDVRHDVLDALTQIEESWAR